VYSVGDDSALATRGATDRLRKHHNTVRQGVNKARIIRVMLPTKIMLIRHAEKPSDNPPPHGVTPHGAHDNKALAVRGWMRAGALAVLFAPTAGKFQNPQFAMPNFIYAMGIGSGSESSRPQQTITPLLEKLADTAQANFYFLKGQENDMIVSVLDKQGVVLICWEHDQLAHAARHVPLSENNRAAVPKEWDGERFDLVWIFDRDEKAEGYLFSQAGQLVLAGDLPA